MIACPVCSTINHHLAITCSSCGSYVQHKVDNLNLFETMWKVIESPRKGFHEIAISRYKNYAIFLSAVAGIGFTFTIFWFLKIGEAIPELIKLLSMGIGLGPFVGIIWMLVFALIVKTISSIARSRISFRNIFAISAYALVPILLTIFSILPIEILTFGSFMFMRTPSPYSLKPFSYGAVMTIDGLCGLWAIILFMIGIKVLTEEKWVKVTFISLISLLVFLALNAVLITFIASKLIIQV